MNHNHSREKEEIPSSFVPFRSPEGRSRGELLQEISAPVPASALQSLPALLSIPQSYTPGKLTPGTIRRLAEEETVRAFHDRALFYRGMLEKEGVIAAHLQTRILAVLACDWHITGKDHAKASEMEQLLRRTPFHQFLRHQLSALAYGYAGSIVEWEEGGRSIRNFRSIPPESLLFDLEGNPALLSWDGKEYPLSLYHPAQFSLHFHTSCGREDPARGGLLRPLLWPYYFKHYALRDRARYLEKFGIPFLIAKIREDDFENEETRNNILSSLSRIASDGSGIITEGSQLQTLESNTSSSRDYQEWMEYLDGIFALLILGQKASSGEAGGFSRGQIQENVRSDILESDCRNLSETIQRQVITPLARFRYGREDDFTFHMDFSGAEDLSTKASILEKLSKCGFSFDPLWVEKTFSITLASNSQPHTKE